MRRKLPYVLLLLCLAPALPPLRGAIEASMSLLMLCLLPCLAMAGWLLCELFTGSHRHLLPKLQPFGLAFFILASFAYGVWMLPIAIDLSRMSSWLGVLRDVSASLSGLAAAIAVRVAPWPVVLFFGGNIVWMSITIGLIFLDAPARLCANYLLGDQHLAGIGLVAYAIGFGLLVLGWSVRNAERFEWPASR